ncbi:MAG TPA: hypothetical protein VFT22_35555, partial [Kofleriaceae bacterium]|nr:hypothetical protein [Kofleriaceae bacterium]
DLPSDPDADRLQRSCIVRRMALAIRSFAKADEDAVVALWRAAGLTRPWINLMVRHDNAAALGFYERTGYDLQKVATLGKRLIVDEER